MRRNCPSSTFNCCDCQNFTVNYFTAAFVLAHTQWRCKLPHFHSSHQSSSLRGQAATLLLQHCTDLSCQFVATRHKSESDAICRFLSNTFPDSSNKLSGYQCLMMTGTILYVFCCTEEQKTRMAKLVCVSVRSDFSSPSMTLILEPTGVRSLKITHKIYLKAHYVRNGLLVHTPNKRGSVLPTETLTSCCLLVGL